MLHEQRILKLARVAHQLISEETDRQRLVGLSSLVLALKPLLDEMPISPDLGTELLEFAQLKRDGQHSQCSKFGEEASNLLDLAEQSLYGHLSNP